jgi:hypothetical protein
MGDSGEGLVDAEARIQERMEELEADRRKRSGGRPAVNPEHARELESLRLAKSNLERQAETVTHPVRKQQIKLAVEEIDKRLAAARQGA